MAEREIGAGMGVQNSRVITLGLGKCEKLDSLEVRFPSGTVARASALAVRRRYLAVEGKPIREIEGIYGPRPALAAPGVAVAEVPAAPGLPVATAVAGVPGAPTGAALLAALGGSDRELLVVELWASWCEACKRLRPRLDRLGERFGEKVRVVGASVEPKDDTAAVRGYLAQHASGHELRPYSKAAVAVAKELLGGQIAATPSTIVLDGKTGRVELAAPGVPSESELERILWRRGNGG